MKQRHVDFRVQLKPEWVEAFETLNKLSYKLKDEFARSQVFQMMLNFLDLNSKSFNTIAFDKYLRDLSPSTTNPEDVDETLKTLLPLCNGYGHDAAPGGIGASFYSRGQLHCNGAVNAVDTEVLQLISRFLDEFSSNLYFCNLRADN